MKHILLVFLAIAMGLISCTHKSGSYNVSGDYMIIGPGGGFRPPQGTYYYLTNNQLLADTSVNLSNPPTDKNLFNFNDSMLSSKHMLVEGALTSIPSELLAMNNKQIGVSHVAVDGGYTVVRTQINGTAYYWIFYDDQSSSGIQQFVAKVNVVFLK